MDLFLFKQRSANRWQKFLHSDVRQSSTKKILSTIVAIFVAFVIGIVIACTVCKAWPKLNNILDEIFTAGYEPKYINNMLSNMAILVVGALSFVFAYKAGLFNIGISGQMVMGGTLGTIICHLGHADPGVNQFVVVLASMFGGAFVAALIGALKAYLKVNEVVSSIMFNWIIYFMSILLLANLDIPHTGSELLTAAPADNLLLRMDGESYIPLLILALISVAALVVFLNFTVFGRKLKVTGLSNTGAFASGYNIKANMILSMALSGLLAGLLGAMVYCGFSPNMPITAAEKVIPQEGFNGISVGLISMCSPVATLPVSLFFSMIKASASDLQVLGIDSHFGDVVFGIVVYGAAAISLFMNLKPYWITIGIFKGKNYSKIKHERNLTNIELLSLSSDQCSLLKKYYVTYKQKHKAKSSLRYSLSTKMKMHRADIAYWFVTQHAKYRVRKNKRFDIITLEYYHRQQLAHLIVKNNKIVIDKEQNKCGGYWITLDPKLVDAPKTKRIIHNLFGIKPAAEVYTELRQMARALQEKPFNNREVRLVSKLAYLQNIRSGLAQRTEFARQNQLVWLTWMQTKQQVEELGLSEIQTKTQFDFAHSAYFNAYYKTYEIVQGHYDMMNKLFPRGKQLNPSVVRFDSGRLAQLYMENLKTEIGKVSYLVNCPLLEGELTAIKERMGQIHKSEDEIRQNKALAHKARAQIKKNSKKGSGREQLLNKYLFKSKIYNNNIISERNKIKGLQAEINKIVSSALKRENILETRKWLARRKANERAQRKLDRIAARKGK